MKHFILAFVSLLLGGFLFFLSVETLASKTSMELRVETNTQELKEKISQPIAKGYNYITELNYYEKEAAYNQREIAFETKKRNEERARLARNARHTSVQGFAGGNCTSYVASHYIIDWRGDGGQWLDNAQAKGHETTKDNPEVGDIIVTGEGTYGHVAVVKEVNYETGTVKIEEMNYKGLGVVSEREVAINAPQVKGYIKVNE